MPFRTCQLYIRTLELFPPAESWLVDSNFQRSSRMQGESYNMAAILQMIGWERHAALVYLVLYFFNTRHPYHDQLTPVKTRYALTSITWPYRGLKFWSLPLTKFGFSIGTRAWVRLTCWKQGRIVRKPKKANPGLKINQIIIFSLLYKLLFFLLCVVYIAII